MSYLTRVFNSPLLRRTPYILNHNMSNVYFISTSNKKNDTTAVIEPTTSEEQTSLPKKKKFFYDYGFYGETEKEEKLRMHFSFFMYISLALMVPIFYFAYRPRMNNEDWALREAYLELRRREQLGLPPIDRNYVDPSTVYLPTDEELGDTEIII